MIASSTSSQPTPVLALQPSTSSGSIAERLLHFLASLRRAGRGQVDLVDHRDDRQVVLHRGVGVGDRLGLDALKRVDQQHGPFAAGERAGDFVLKVDVARRVDQVQLVGLAAVADNASRRRGP